MGYVTQKSAKGRLILCDMVWERNQVIYERFWGMMMDEVEFVVEVLCLKVQVAV